MQEAGKAFICYRRLDSFVPSAFHKNFQAALLSQGFTGVFLDTDPQSGTHPQEDFESKAFHAIEECDLFVVLIGAQWLTLLDAKKDVRDVVAREIRAALHYEKDILPVLVDDASMPPSTRAPKEIQAFLKRGALETTF